MAENVVRQLADRSTEAKKGMEQAYATASKGAVDFSLQLIDMAQTNTNAVFDFARQLARVKSPSEFMELTTSHTRKHVELLSEQAHHLATMAQKMTTESVQPFQAGFGKHS